MYLANDKDILEKLAKRTASYLEELLPLSISGDFKIEKIDTIEYLDNSSFITFSNGISSTVGMSVSNGLASQITKAFIFGEPTKDEIIQLKQECIKEVLNITVGNIISDLELVKSGAIVNISTPFTTEKESTIKRKEKKRLQIKLQINNTSIILFYFK